MDARRKQNGNKVHVLNKASSYSNYRNLGKSQLGGVIFGCKTASIDECLNIQLFGLPGNHMAYVKNIEPGLPLFLFNYSTRRLHGIFEAASPGTLNINPYAWTADGSNRTRYPAQVQIRVRLHCQSVDEEQFKAIIHDNYYSSKHFWFELDHAQTDGLLSLLSSVVIAPSTFVPKLTKERRIPLTAQRRELENEGVDTAVTNVDFARFSSSNRSLDKLNVDSNRSFETSSEWRTEVESEKDLIYMKLKELALNRKRLDQSSSVDNNVVVDGENLEQEGLLQVTDDHSGIAHLKKKVEEFNTFKPEQSQKMEYLQQKLVEAEAAIKWLKERYMILESRSSSYVTTGHETARETFTELNFDINEFMYLIGGYDGTQSLSSLDCYSPSLDIVKSLQPMSSARSYAAVAKLNGEIYVFGGGNGSLCYNTVEAYNPAKNTWNSRPSLNRLMGSLAGATVNDKVFALGGGNGHESFSEVEMLDLDAGRWIPTQSMRHKRFALAAVEHNGAIYAAGGFDGKGYLKSVERLDPREHSWTKVASMTSPRSCHCLLVMNEKLYALGGYDGKEMVTSTEIYDPRVGSWTTGAAMNTKRGYAAAALLKKSLYIIGGVENTDNLADTIECYEEGQGWNLTNLKAVGHRCFASAVVF
ncbi:uncharacterized protein LOC141705973 [Apium graveolens]|uniref:uncharacterized protein LOC141705973 n=1 Tax=Apium graveolens TaxID=4045 RepID=UPI003D7B7E79